MDVGGRRSPRPFFSMMAKRRKSSFSPNLMVASRKRSLMVLPLSVLHSRASSFVLGSLSRTALLTALTRSRKGSELATKSVSQLISMMAALLPLVRTQATPSAAVLPAFFSCLEIPFSRSQTMAFFDIAIVFEKGLLAVHQSGTGSIAENLDQFDLGTHFYLASWVLVSAAAERLQWQEQRSCHPWRQGRCC